MPFSTLINASHHAASVQPGRAILTVLVMVLLAPWVSAQFPVEATPQPGIASLEYGSPLPSGEFSPRLQTSNEVTSKAASTSAGTEVPVPADLKDLLENGGEPSSIKQLKLLERQNQFVATRGSACTVSVQIGPAQGCGVIITESGYVLTAAHVAMRPGKNAQVTLSNGRTVVARTLGMNRNVDAGLMKIEPNQNNGRPWPHATLGTSKNLTPGMWCIATGHPGGYDPSRGPVARVGRILRTRLGAIETDCALIGGDSGGPLFDIAGRLIAVHSRIGNDVSENLHVPVDFYGTSWDRMRAGEAYGYLPGFRPVLGVTGSSSGPRAVVDIVKPGSPAEEAGIVPGDEINQFGETGITNFEALKSAVSNTMPGERVPIWLRREGRSIRVVVEIGRAD
ncbi:S1C family serine protease [Rubripirellula amarantea]|nr:S1C family serine protease [Rubripirellula amarantea]